MRRVASTLWAFSGLCCLLLVGCADGKEDAKIVPALATVGDVAITGDDLDRVSQRFGTDGTSGTDAWRHSLQLLIDKQLLLLEGYRLGLHESATVRAAAAASHRRNLTEALLEERYHERLTPSDGQVQAWFDSTKAGREIRVSRVVIGHRATALKALRQANADPGRLEDLEIPAEAVISRGDLGWLSSLATRDPRMGLLFEREIGSVELIESKDHFFLMEVTDRREFPFAERSEAARAVLEGQRRAQVNMEFLESLLEKYQVRVDTASMQKLAGRAETGRLDSRMRLVQSSLGDWSLGEYQRAADLLNEDVTEGANVSASTGALGFRVTRAFVVAQLLPLEATEAGLDDSLAALRDAVVKRGTIEALWAMSGFGPESASREPERFDEYLERLRQRFADRVHLDEDAYVAYIAEKRRGDAPVEY
ncbi:MAG: hypothetical protein QF689_07875 [Candidatus Latescibacteria bacterium]|nr:hypothetical protein [Candidatus Latescibacterota bacterium]MDP7448485.1 hypothetical protein [Candidatus Latescibacterota bacterium]HJP31222.1 hypothetical protein [Candidatus Latescibacterota bacterium]